MDQISTNTVRIALVGDFDESVAAHQAIPIALERIASELQVQVQLQWIPTPEVEDGQQLKDFDGVWCVPASPYLDMNGALTAIRFARKGRVPFLGTCGGFQHALIEYARNHLGWVNAEHAETAPDSPEAIITLLSCGLVEAFAPIHLLPDSLIAQAYGALITDERYRCRYGLRPELVQDLFTGPLHVVGRDADGEIRAVELQGHPFFIATLFQPERSMLEGITPPLVRAFVQACRAAS